MSFSGPVRKDEELRRGDVDKIFAAADREYENLFDLYRHFHANPELSGAEENTARRFAAELEAAGFQVTRGVGGHGVVGVLENGEGPTVMVRADLDALPIQEETGLPYASSVSTKDADGREVGVMHACGHDIHMTVLVGTARLLMRCRDDWSGTVILIGQPAEETGTGAVAMIEDGLFTRFPRPDAILALHVVSPMPAGIVGYCEGAAMAGCASLELRVRGIGGHGSRPHEVKDPVVMAAETVLLLQTVVSREVDPKETAVLTVGSIHGGSRSNIIPDEVLLQINYRYFKEGVDRQIRSAIERIANGVAIAVGVAEDRMPVLTTLMTGPPVINDARLVRRLASSLSALLGEEKVLKLDPLSASDDFAHFGFVAPNIPLFYFFLGVADPNKVAECTEDNRPYPGIHNPAFAPLPEPTIKTGVKAMACAVLDLLSG
jgi:hippurate hydrolase